MALGEVGDQRVGFAMGSFWYKYYVNVLQPITVASLSSDIETKWKGVKEFFVNSIPMISENGIPEYKKRMKEIGRLMENKRVLMSERPPYNKTIIFYDRYKTGALIFTKDVEDDSIAVIDME